MEEAVSYPVLILTADYPSIVPRTGIHIPILIFKVKYRLLLLFCREMQIFGEISTNELLFWSALMSFKLVVGTHIVNLEALC